MVSLVGVGRERDSNGLRFPYWTLWIISSFLKLFPLSIALIQYHQSSPLPSSIHSLIQCLVIRLLPYRKESLFSSPIISLLPSICGGLINLYFHLSPISKSPVPHNAQPSVEYCCQYAPKLKINLKIFPYLIKNLLLLTYFY